MKLRKKRHADNATEKELLAIVWSVKHFRQYLYGKKFLIYTDHKPLLSLRSMNNQNAKLMKMKTDLEEFEFEIKYKKGKVNTNADSLSRMFLVICNDEDVRETLLNEFHATPVGAHRSPETTALKIKDHGYTWSSIIKDAKETIKRCKKCQENKKYKTTKLPMIITDTSSEPWEKCSIDIVGHLPKTYSGHEYLLTFQDNLTKFSLSVPLVTQEATEVSRAFAENIVLQFGMPRCILTDQGSNFMSKIFRNLCKLFKISRIRTSAFHPQSNGSLERSHRALKEYFRHFIDENQRNCDELSKFASFAYNTSVHASTKYTPYELLFGRKPIVPSSIANEREIKTFYSYDDYVMQLRHNLQTAFQLAKRNLEQTKEQRKERYDRTAQNKTFDVGEEVQLLNETARQGRSKKFGPQWLGPYHVLEKIGDVNYKIKMGRTTKVVHGNKLKSYYD